MIQSGKYQKTDKTIKRSGKLFIVVFSVIVLCLLAAVLFMWFKNWDTLLSITNVRTVFAGNAAGNGNSNNDSATEISSFQYNVSDHPVFCTYKDFIIKCGADYVVFLDRKGNEVSKIDLPLMNKPMLKVAGSYLLVADAGGKKLYLIKDKDIVWNWSAENKIINADLAENGFVSVIQEVKGYKASVSVFNPDINEPIIFTRSLAEKHLLSVKITPSGKQIVLNRIDTSGVKLASDLEFSYLTSAKPFADISFDGLVFPVVSFFRDGALLAAGDLCVVICDRNRKEKWKMNYEEGQLLSAGVFSDRYAIVASLINTVNGLSDNKTEMKIINNSGHISKSCVIDGRVINIASSGGVVAANLGSEVYFLNLKGKVTGKYSSMAKVKELYFLNNKEVLVVAWGKIVVLKV